MTLGGVYDTMACLGNFRGAGFDVVFEMCMERVTRGFRIYILGYTPVENGDLHRRRWMRLSCDCTSLDIHFPLKLRFLA